MKHYSDMQVAKYADRMMQEKNLDARITALLALNGDELARMIVEDRIKEGN